MTDDTPNSKRSTPNSKQVRSATVLAFDFGEKRIGVAVADVAVAIAHPLATIHAEDNKTRFAAIDALIAEWKPLRLVVGEPQYPDGRAHEIGRLARRFAQRLEGRCGLPVTLVDESLSSHTAEARLRETGVRGGKRKAVLDAAAACEIMQTWFERQHKNT